MLKLTPKEFGYTKKYVFAHGEPAQVAFGRDLHLPGEFKLEKKKKKSITKTNRF